MSNKQLTAKVRFNTSQAEQSITKLVKKLDKLNNTANQINSSQKKLDTIVSRAKEWGNAQNKVLNKTKATSNVLSTVGSKLRRIAATYLGFMGAKAAVNTTDLLVGAQNRLNYVNATQLGDAGYTSEGAYSTATLNATQEALDKMYVSSQKVRTSYQGMMSNVAKTMALAGGAFDNNIDNAIRFQEIMAEAYAVGGASAQEMSNSMYQLTQALGSGILQGDELRSLREGAPLAYQAIEKFAQGVYNTTDSLKDMASQGKITSDIVVAAIMSEGNALDAAFAQTAQTFGQTFDQIKNAALYAFQPVMKMLTTALAEAVENGMVQKLEVLFTNIAKAVIVAFNIIEAGVTWLVDNLPTIIKGLTTIAIIIGVLLIPKLIAMAGMLITNIINYLALGAAAVASAVQAFVAWAVANWQLALIIVIIAAVIIAVMWLADSFADACGMIVGGVFFVQTVIYNVVMFIINIVSGVINAIVLMAGNIGIAFYNAWQNAKIAFWDWVKDCLDGTSWIAKAVSKVASIFGLDGTSIDANITAAEGKIKDLYTQDEILAGFTTMEYKDPMEAYENGYNIGFDWGQSVEDNMGGLLDTIGNALGLDFSSFGEFPTDGISPDLEKILDDINGDTTDMADTMKLTKEDLEYMRRVADMEWKKEFTTAEIKVDMSNYNSISGDGDLDGIVTKLSDKLYEELNAVANGVYA